MTDQTLEHRYCEITEFVLDDIAEIITAIEIALKGKERCECGETRGLLAAAVRLKQFVDPTGFEMEH